MNISKPTASSIAGVEFDFLSDEDVKSLSVKQIVNPLTYDAFNNVVPGGLYDLALGAYLDNHCTTCNLSRVYCPGHCGHIDLPVPVYHPIYFDQILRLLRAQCPYCYMLRVSREDVDRARCKLRLVRYGLLDEVKELDILHLRGDFARYAAAGARGIGKRQDVADSDSDMPEEQFQCRATFVKRAIREATAQGRITDWTQEKQESVSEARRKVIKDFLMVARDPLSCKNCKARCPKYRADRSIKVFREPRNPDDAAKNAMLGLQMKPAHAYLVSRHRAITKQHEKPLTNGHIDEGVADLSSASSEGEGDDVLMDERTMDESLNVDAVIAAPETEEESSEDDRKKKMKPQYINPLEAHALLTLLFEKEPMILQQIYGGRIKKRQKTSRADDFFIKCLLVPPSKFRPEARAGGSITEAKANRPYQDVLQASQLISQVQAQTKSYYAIQQPWIGLQNHVNGLIDKNKNTKRNAEDGIKQILEKKDGLFRYNMMGKRVNFAARTVISPDPNIETNEIGVPPVFAKKLTYPEPVMNENYYDLKQAVLNGPDTWPGATAIENENGQVINLRSKTYDERMALANQLLAPSNTNANGSRGKKVHRHLNNGDVVIMNRQPSLHKPSMMAHRARVLPSEKTLRMHYANCNSYNADFDGDEMNMHFPQNEVARAEASTLADTDHQYLSATAGAPLRGLIQDHISICVQLTKRDTFFTREDYHQLLYAALRPENNHTSLGRLQTLPPAIRKPIQLWTGKQIIATVLENLVPADQVGGLSMSSKSKTDKRLWGDESEEAVVIFDTGYFVQGILDKNQIGPVKGGLVHSVYEAYGHTIAGRLLSVLGRLLTKMLSSHAFSCGIEDLVLDAGAEQNRLDALKDVDKIGLEVATKYVSLGEATPTPQSGDPELVRRLEDVLRDDSKQSVLDELAKAEANKISTAVEVVCNPVGLIKPFPKNQMQSMTQSGAKGSSVNANLISCNLGSQVLEARRVPTMVSGKTLPSFKPYETSLRAGGYIVQRFLTGIRPQEYYFHTMAGREGLIDTAVKTSRSGYLQRCLVKGMEGLRAEYDSSVRDSDGTLIQFIYGEDGLDVSSATFLDNFTFSAKNFWSLYETLQIRDNYNKLLDPKEELDSYVKNTQKAVRKANKIGRHVDVPDPAINVWQPGRYVGAMSEKMQDGLKDYLQNNPDRLINDKKNGITGGVSKGSFEGLVRMKYLKSVVVPGEAVGVVVGQSIGEPSTQMTLNTFHLAGHSGKNVTMGIPRLREIVMTASQNISTPSMTLRLISELKKEDAVQFAKGISRLTLAEVVDSVTVEEVIGKGVGANQAKTYHIILHFFPKAEYEAEYAITKDDILDTLERSFIPLLVNRVKKAQASGQSNKFGKRSDALPEIGKSSGRERRQAEPVLDENGEATNGAQDSDDDADDDGADDAKEKRNRREVVGYGNKDAEDVRALQDAGEREETPLDDEADVALPKHRKRDSQNVESAENEGNEDSPEARKARRRARAIERAEVRENRIKNKNQNVAAFDFDYVSGQRCTVSLEYEVNAAKILILHIVETCCRNAIIQAVPNIKSCSASTEKIENPLNPAEPIEVNVVYTDGVNIPAMQEYQDVINPNQIQTNSIHDMLRYYGVEAARSTVIAEMNSVFSSHHISVNNRHLNLIADVMTRAGTFIGFQRTGLMSQSTSPFMKMSFETTVGFLKDAVLNGESEELKGPSSRIVVGKMGTMGTGMMDVLMPVKEIEVGDVEMEDADSAAATDDEMSIDAA